MKKSLCIVGLLGLTAGISSASFVVDSFNGNLNNSTVNQVADPNGGGCNTSNANGETNAAIGGYRKLTASRGGSTGCATANVNFNFADAYSTDLPTSTSGRFSVIWDGNGNGLGNTLIGVLNFSAFQDVNNPPGTSNTVSFTACSNANGTGTCLSTANVSIVNLGTTAADFAAYSANFGGLVSANYIRMDVNGPAGRDLVIDFINGDVPEPSTFALAGIALLGVGLIRARRA